MTSKQTDFIARLVSEKVLPEGDPRTRFLSAPDFLSEAVDRMTVTQGSAAIDWLLTLPNRDAQASSARVDSQNVVEAGRYALVAPDGVVKFYRVDRPTEGKWAGWTFLKAQASDDEWPIKNADEKARILAEIAEDAHGAMIRYGHEIGCCGRCGRTLTDETSRAAGIGPECAKILGIDRTGADGSLSAARSYLDDGDGPDDPGLARGYDTDAIAILEHDDDRLAEDLIERIAERAPAAESALERAARGEARVGS